MKAIEQTKKHESRSEHYVHFNSGDIVSTFSRYGYNPVAYSEKKTRKESIKGFQKHVITFDTGIGVDGNMLRLLVTNSHDGSGSLKLNIGIFRLVCANGLVVGSSFYESRFNHTLRGHDRLLAEIKELPFQIGRVSYAIKKMSDTVIDETLKRNLTDKVYELRGLNNLKGNVPTFGAQRVGDLGSDLYTYYNIAQENLIRGNFPHAVKVVRKGVEREYIRQALPIRGVVRQLELNKQLFDYVYNLAS
jgi:hypothetical protein